MKNKLFLLLISFSIFLNANTIKQNENYVKYKSTITNYIIKNNKKIPYTLANKYADTIMKESIKRGHSPYVQAALLNSESTFRANPKHDLKNVIGIGGVYWSVWGKELKAQGIAYSKDDLRNPIIGIKASAYILSIYMKKHKSPNKALTYYKGYSKLGKKQALLVMNNVKVLKNIEMNS